MKLCSQARQSPPAVLSGPRRLGGPCFKAQYHLKSVKPSQIFLYISTPVWIFLLCIMLMPFDIQTSLENAEYCFVYYISNSQNIFLLISCCLLVYSTQCSWTVTVVPCVHLSYTPNCCIILIYHWSERGESKTVLKLNIQNTKIMASSSITSWLIHGETMETMTDFIFLGSKITADGDCSHEIKRHLLLGRKAMTNLDSILKSRDIILLTKVHLVRAVVFPVVMYGCESWTIEKAECWRIDAFELWYWTRLLRVTWTARRLNQSILKEINPEYSLEGLILKLQYFGHLMQRADSLEKTLMLGKTEGRRRRGQQMMKLLDSITNLMDMSLSKLQ